MRPISFFKMIVLMSISISLMATNTAALDLLSAGHVDGGGSALFNPAFPDVPLPDFNTNTGSTHPGTDYQRYPASGVDYGRLHRYFGYATVALAGVAAVTSSNKSLHYGAAYAATGTALLTCWTGYEEYSERFDLDEELLSQDNLHILLGVIGTAAIVTAVATADSGDESSHAGVGVAGGSMMMASVVVMKINF